MVDEFKPTQNGVVNRAKSILILNKEVQACVELACSMEESGYRIEHGSSLSEHQLTRLDLAQFDLILCDSDDGCTEWKSLLNCIRSQKLATQVVLTSSNAGEQDWYEALQLGVFDFLVKPFAPSEVQRITLNALSINYSRNFQMA